METGEDVIESIIKFAKQGVYDANDLHNRLEMLIGRVDNFVLVGSTDSRNEMNNIINDLIDYPNNDLVDQVEATLDNIRDIIDDIPRSHPLKRKIHHIDNRFVSAFTTRSSHINYLIRKFNEIKSNDGHQSVWKGIKNVFNKELDTLKYNNNRLRELFIEFVNLKNETDDITPQPARLQLSKPQPLPTIICGANFESLSASEKGKIMSRLADSISEVDNARAIIDKKNAEISELLQSANRP